MTVHVIPVWRENPYDCPEISTVSNSASLRDLSPFHLGPIETYETGVVSQNFENLWQYSKVYPIQVDKDGNPSEQWFKWRSVGWRNERAVRYPMGKGAIPLYSWWDGRKLGYIEARKQIYAAIYAKYVVQTVCYSLVKEEYLMRGEVTLKDYDAYDHIALGMSLVDVINNPNRKMGHAFVLAMLLEHKLDECLKL